MIPEFTDIFSIIKIIVGGPRIIDTINEKKNQLIGIIGKCKDDNWNKTWKEKYNSEQSIEKHKQQDPRY
jgi:hypothetical protein